MTVQVVSCERCGAPCKHNPKRNPNARLLRHAPTPQGVCAGCAMTRFLKTTEPLASLIRSKGPSVLLKPDVQQAAERLLPAGDSDAKQGEVNWQAVVDWWEFP